MLEIVQAGQSGKTSLLFDMHRLRKRVFKDRMRWDVRIQDDDLEVDQFDLPETVYLLALDNSRRVVGNWRLLPTSGPTMIRDVWPEFLQSIEMPSSPFVWEGSRFAVDGLTEYSEKSLAQVSPATKELFCGLTELCLLCGIKRIFTMYDMRIARLLERLDCHPCRVSKRAEIGGIHCQVGEFITDDEMLFRIRSASREERTLVYPEMLPPVLRLFLETQRRSMDNANQLFRNFAHYSGDAAQYEAQT